MEEQDIPIRNNGLGLHLLLSRRALLPRLARLDDWLAKRWGFRVDFFVGGAAEFGDTVGDRFGCYVDAVC